MLRKVHRLSSKDFPILLRRGILLRTPCVDVRYQKNTNDTCMGFVVSKSLDKRASHRNRTKRLFREQVRLFMTHTDPHLHAVFIIRKPFSKKPSELPHLVESLFKSMTASV